MMARIAAETIMKIDHGVDTVYEILAAQGLWTVRYLNKPINIIRHHDTVRGQRHKYLHSTYANSGAAENLARRLNRYFSCQDFTVAKII